MVQTGRVQMLMKGHLHTDELLHEVMKKDGGLRGTRRLSHVFVMDVPGLEHLLLISDAAINISPTLEEKVDITQNAIDLALALGMTRHRSACFPRSKRSRPKSLQPSTRPFCRRWPSAARSRAGVVDGPLAMDNAIDIEAAKTKGITSLVAGHARS